MPDPMPSTEAGRVRRPGFDSKSPPAEPAGRRLAAVVGVAGVRRVRGVRCGRLAWPIRTPARTAGGEPPLIRAAPRARSSCRRIRRRSRRSPRSRREVGRHVERCRAGSARAPAAAPEQPLAPPSRSTPSAATGQPGGAEPRTPRVAALPSDDGVGASRPDQALPEAEAALDRLLAEVTAVSEVAGAPGASAAKPAGAMRGRAMPPAEPIGRRAAETGRGTAPASCRNAARERTRRRGAAGSGGGPAERARQRRRRGAPRNPAPPPAPPQKPSAPPATAATRRGRASGGRDQQGGASAGAATAAATEPRRSARPRRRRSRAMATSASSWRQSAARRTPGVPGSCSRAISGRRCTGSSRFSSAPTPSTACSTGSRSARSPDRRRRESLCEQLKQRNASCFVIRR